MIFLQDDESKQQFLVDTGAICSVLPHRSQTASTDPPISGADGKDIPCWGRICRRLTFGLPPFSSPFTCHCLQTHTRIRLLVRPLAAGRPSQPPGAGREVSETALQTDNRRRGNHAPNSPPPSAPEGGRCLHLSDKIQFTFFTSKSTTVAFLIYSLTVVNLTTRRKLYSILNSNNKE